MFEVYTLLNNSSFQSTLLSNDRLLFEFSHYEIIFDLKNDNSEDFHEEFQHGNLEPFQLKKLAEKEVLDCFIGSTEYLGYRPDIIDFNKPISVCCRMYEVLRTIQDINPNSVGEYFLTQNEGYNEDVEGALFCSLEPNYVFEIHITESSYSNSNFFKQVLSKVQVNEESNTPPHFYWLFYKRCEKISDSGKLLMISTNTKVRRLGYFKLLSEFMSKHKKIPSNFINKKFEKYSAQYESSLNEYKNNKGLIKITKTGISTNPYIETAKNMGLINLLNNVYSSGKLLKVYQVLKNELTEESGHIDNVFYLSKLDKLFFLETILREDFLYTSLILEIINLKEKTNYIELSPNFYQLLLTRLNELSDNIWPKRGKEYREIKKVYERVKKWKKAEVYMEHILMPRLNWLFDLKLIEMDQSFNIKMTNIGKKLFNNLCYWNDINWSWIISPNEFLNRFAVHVFDNIYFDSDVKEDRSENISKDEIKKKSVICLENSFQYFKTLAPNRVTASQAITYSKYKLYLTYNIMVGHQFIVNFLKSKEQDIFVYKFQKQYGDGYIQKIKK